MRAVVASAVIAVLAALLPGCGPQERSPQPTVSEETMPPTDLTVAEAAQENARLVSLVSGETVDPAPDRVEKVGCRTDPESFMSVGPPWRLRTTWWVDNPPAPLVDQTLARLAGLTSEGFERQPWTRPDPEPAHTRTYQDQRGYIVTASAEKSPAGRYMLEVTAMSPCAND